MLKKILKKTLKVIGILFLVYIAVMGSLIAYMLIRYPEIPPFDDSAMDPVRPDVPEDENAYPLIDKAITVFKAQFDDYKALCPGRNILQEFISTLKSQSEPSAEQTEKVEQLTGESFQLLEQAGKRKYSQTPADYGPDGSIFDKNIFHMILLMRVLTAEALYDFNKGNRDAADLQLMSLFELAKKLDFAEGGSRVTSIMISCATKLITLKAFNNMLNDKYLPSDNISTDSILTELLSSETIWQNIRKREYQYYKASVDQMEEDFKEQRYNYILSDVFSDEDIPLLYKLLTPLGFTQFRPMNLKKRFFDVETFLVENEGGKYYSQHKFDIPEWDKHRMEESDTWLGDFRSVLRREQIELVFISFAIETDHLKRVAQKRFFTDFAVQATRVRLALLRYAANHGELPDSLDALVPEYFSEVPYDPFDGQPVRYDPERKIIYSVNHDLEDNGGEAVDKLFIDNNDWREWEGEKDIVVDIF